MAKDWASFGVDLHLEPAGPRRRAALEDALREAVRSNRLVGGTPLPSSRALAAELGLARNTVADAYGQLVAEGWLTARQGAATRVAERVAPVTDRPRRPRPDTGRLAYDLRAGQPDLASFPRNAWSSAARKALTAAPNDALGYQDPRGLAGLRETLTHYLGRVRGVRTTPERVVVCAGFVQAIGLLATALSRGGVRAFAVESYGLPLHRELLHAAGLSTAPLTVDAGGARIDELQDVGAVLLTPAHQFPIGVPLTAARRAAVLQWARDAGAVVVEDDYDGEFRYDARPVGALQGLAPDLVAYVGTASKTLAPGLRLAWIVTPPKLLDTVVEAKRLSDGFTGVLEQLTLDEFLRSGAYDRHVRRARLGYRHRRDRLVSQLAERSPGVTVTGIAAGLHAVVRLGDGVRARDEAALRTRAARAGLAIQGLDQFRHHADPKAPAALVVGYGTPPEHSFAGALDTLCDVLA